jgi:hypothetical protein
MLPLAAHAGTILSWPDARVSPCGRTLGGIPRMFTRRTGAVRFAPVRGPEAIWMTRRTVDGVATPRAAPGGHGISPTTLVGFGSPRRCFVYPRSPRESSNTPPASLIGSPPARFHRVGCDIDPSPRAGASPQCPADPGHRRRQRGAAVRAPATGNGREPVAQRACRSDADGPQFGGGCRRALAREPIGRPDAGPVGSTSRVGSNHGQGASDAGTVPGGSGDGARRRASRAHRA